MMKVLVFIAMMLLVGCGSSGDGDKKGGSKGNGGNSAKSELKEIMSLAKQNSVFILLNINKAAFDTGVAAQKENGATVRLAKELSSKDVNCKALGFTDPSKISSSVTSYLNKTAHTACTEIDFADSKKGEAGKSNFIMITPVLP